MSEALTLADTYCDSADADAQQTGWYTLMLWAEALTWACGTEKSSGNAFTSHIEAPRSSFKYTPRPGGFKRQQGARFGDIEKSAIYTLGGPQ
jgi:hypothetical protein